MALWKKKEEPKPIPYCCCYMKGRTGKREFRRVSDGNYIIPVVTFKEKDMYGNNVYTTLILLYADAILEGKNNDE